MDRRGHLRGLLIGLGSLVVADLPKVDTRVSLDDFVDKPRLEANQAATRTLEAGQKSTDDQRARLVPRLDAHRGGVRLVGQERIERDRRFLVRAVVAKVQIGGFLSHRSPP